MRASDMRAAVGAQGIPGSVRFLAVARRVCIVAVVSELRGGKERMGLHFVVCHCGLILLLELRVNFYAGNPRVYAVASFSFTSRANSRALQR
jgi:hypothetical protein